MTTIRAFFLATMLCVVSGGHAAEPRSAECIVPARGGGGFDLTCRLAQVMLADTHALRLTYLPGGIGALAFDTVVRQRRADASAIVAFSSGSLLNLAQGRFGPHTERDIRWVAVVGTDYGVVAVPQDSPYRSLADLLTALRADPRRVVFGAGGTIGSQDWVKAALLARAAGVTHKAIRFVAFEGGGEALKALEGRHIGVFTGDAAEVAQFIGKGGAVRVLAVLSEQRLRGEFAGAPTAREQGLDLVWPTARGFYMGPGVPDGAYAAWVESFRNAMSSARFADQRIAHGLYPMSLSGDALQSFIAESVLRYRRLAAEFQLLPQR